MFSGAKQNLLLPALLFLSMAFLNACENDLKKIKEISAKQSTNPIQETTGVDVIYSDSAKVKLRMLAPVLLQLVDPKDEKKNYDEMPKGVQIIFYDSTKRETGRITSDYAINHSTAKLIEFRKNVVATNAQGDTFRSDELFWDQVKKIMYSNKPVVVNMISGDIIHGNTFTSDEKLTNPKFTNGNGVVYTNDSPQN